MFLHVVNEWQTYTFNAILNFLECQMILDNVQCCFKKSENI